MSVIARRGLFRKATKTLRPNRPPRSTGQRGALLQILLGHDTQGGGGEGVEGDRGTERRDERPPEVKASPISHFDRESRLSLSIIAKKGSAAAAGEDVLQRARAAAQQALSLTYIRMLLCATAGSLHLEWI